MNIKKTFSKSSVSILKSVVLCAACLLCAAAVVFPLWYFAVSSPFVYTVVILAICATALLYFIIKNTKKYGIRKTVTVFLRIVIIAAGIAGAAALVFNGHRFFAIPVIIAVPFLFIICK